MVATLEPVERATQKVILPNASWETYERLLAENQDNSGVRFNYDRGRLEIMVLSLRHEKLKHTLATIVELIAGEYGLDFEGAGSTTFRREDLERGFEPDACFYFQNVGLIRQKDEIDLTEDPSPDLVIEVDITSPSLDKFPIFAALNVREVWRYEAESVAVYTLVGNECVRILESGLLMNVTSETLTNFLIESRNMSRSLWQRRIREWAQNNMP